MVGLQESLMTEGYHEDKRNTDKEIQLEKPDFNRPTQEIFNEKTVIIGFCGTGKDFECTVSAISAANYIAIGGYKAALVEPDFTKGTVLDKFIPGLFGKDRISIGNVDYYTGWNLTQEIYSVDVIIIDFSGMNYEESVYLSKMKKIFLCSDNDNMDVSQTNKLQNNNSFKYSILFRDNSIEQNVRPENETMNAFKDCSMELKRLLKITLLSYGIDITNNTEDASINRINELNILNQAECLKVNAWNIKPEREVKQNKQDFNKEKSISDKIPLPVTPSIQSQRTVSVPKGESIRKSEDLNSRNVNRQITAGQVKQIHQSDQEPAQSPVSNIKDKLRPQESTYAASAISNSYNRENFKNTGQDVINQDNPSASSARALFANAFIENKPNSFSTEKKEEKNSILPKWFSMGKDIKDEESNIPYSSNLNTVRNDDEYEDSDENSYDNDNEDGFEDKYGEINNLNYVEDNKYKLRKKQSANQVLCGKETIFITGLKHGCGCSHTGLSFAKYILSAYRENICVCHKKGAYDLEDEGITEYTKDTDYDAVFGTNRFIIYDCGILGELNSDQLVELKRCNIKIMICNGDEKYLGNLSKFIRNLGNSSDEWIFAFNLVTSKEKEAIIRKIMQGYKICFIPLHDCDSLPKKVTKMWDSVLKRNLL